MTVTADALDMLAGDPPRTRKPGDFHRHPTTGAPYVNHPTETTKDGSPRRVMYGRPSSFGTALDNPYNLVKWKERQLLIGIADLELNNLGPSLLNFDPDDRDALDQLAARCHEAAGSHLAADQGTHIHLLCEQNDRDQLDADLFAAGVALGIPEALQFQIVAQWNNFRTRLGVTAVGIEQTVVNDRWRLAGTLDRLDVPNADILTSFGILNAGEEFVGDIKTGGLTLGNDGQPSRWIKYPVQLAAYAFAVPYDVDTDERGEWELQPNPEVALIYHYDLARALDGEPVDWQAIPVNLEAGWEGGELCRAAADFAKRFTLFAMPAPTTTVTVPVEVDLALSIAAPATASSGERQAAEPEPSVAHAVAGSAAKNEVDAPKPVGEAESRRDTRTPGAERQEPPSSGRLPQLDDLRDHIEVTTITDQEPQFVNGAASADKLRARIKELIDAGHEAVLRQWWPETVPLLSKSSEHTAEQLERLLDFVRRVEAEAGMGWHPDDGPTPPPNPQPDVEAHVDQTDIDALNAAYNALNEQGRIVCAQIAGEAHQAGRSISVSADPTVRRWSIARAVIAWAASGKSVDELWMRAAMLATFDQCADADATLGGLISQFSVEQADRLHDAAEVAG